MAVAEHRSLAPPELTVRVVVVSVSDSRTLETDEGGRLIQTLTAAAGFSVVGRKLVPDEPVLIRSCVNDLVAAGGVDAILLTGGTGFAPRDTTVDALAPLFDRRLDGFGELFRMLSFAEIGPAAMLSRATAGIVGGAVVFLMPGAPAGVRLALEKLILPELAHLVGQLRRSASAGAGNSGGAEPSAEHRPGDHNHGHGHGRHHR